jgi:thiamine-phosphate pyrophosphorylase
LLEHVSARGPTRPWFAIGGIDATTIEQVIAAGARRVVVVRAITDAADPRAAAAALVERLRAAAGEV